MEAAPEFQSQADFARHMGVSRAAVSQWKKKDILRADAFSQPGKTGKVVVAVAIEQVRRNRDIGQALGNGIETRTSSEGAGGPNVAVDVAPELLKPVLEPTHDDLPAESSLPPKTNSVEDQLKRVKLEQEMRRNRIQASEEALRQGLLVSAEDARKQMTTVAQIQLKIFEGALVDFAAAMASKFKVPQHDVLHLLKNEFRAAREAAAHEQKTQKATLEQEVQTSVDMDA